MNDSFSYFSVIASTSDMEDSASEQHDADIGSNKMAHHKVVPSPLALDVKRRKVHFRSLFIPAKFNKSNYTFFLALFK